MAWWCRALHAGGGQPDFVRPDFDFGGQPDLNPVQAGYRQLDFEPGGQPGFELEVGGGWPHVGGLRLLHPGTSCVLSKICTPVTTHRFWDVTGAVIFVATFFRGKCVFPDECDVEAWASGDKSHVIIT